VLREYIKQSLMQDEYHDTKDVADINASENFDKSAEEDPSPDGMKDQKIVVVDAGQDAISVKLKEIKYVQDDGVQEKAAFSGSIAQVEEMKRCMLKKMCVYYC